MKIARPSRVALAALLFWPVLSIAQSLQSPSNVIPANAGAPYLLTDGTVLVQNNFTTGWVKLTPDQFGSYVNGTWSTVASLPTGFSPLYYAAGVLADGRLVIIGGEDNYAPNVTYSDTNLGAVYNPKSNTWTPIVPPTGWANIGDAPSVILPSGQFLLGDAFSSQIAVLNPATLTWTFPTSTGKATSNNEEGYTLLPDGSVLDVNVSSTGAAQRYLPSTGQWISAGNTPQPLESAGEMGPAVLRPNGTVFAMGASGANAVYTPPTTLTGTGSWIAAPGLAVGDAPACLLPDGNVLVENGAGFYEFDGTNLNLLLPVAELAYAGRLLALPNGQVLFTNGGAQFYTPASGTLNSAWAPTITTFPATIGPGATYAISGTQFNGLSQAVAYGDDYQAATNYPLVRITNAITGHVFYARTHDHSTMAVATGSAIVSTNFDVPANIEPGASTLVVVANGIPSASVSVTVGTLKATSTALVSSLNPSTGGQGVTLTATVTGSGGTPTGTVTFLDGVIRIGTGTLNASGVATFSTSSLIVAAHSITATYGGDTNFASSTSTALTQTVTGTASAAALTSSLNPSGYSASTTFTVTVSGSGGTPTGTVAFFDGASWLGSSTLSGGAATFSSSALPVGSHAVTAQYSGDTGFAASTSNLVTQVVSPVATTTVLTSSRNPAPAGTALTFTATVTTTGGTASGTVTFLDSTTTLGTGGLNGSGVATLTTSVLAGGSHPITARYGGDPSHAASTSNLVTQVVLGSSPATAVLTSSLNPAVFGQTVTFTATLTGSSVTPTGAITFNDGATALGTGTLNGSGVATFTASTLASGPQSITAQYSGDTTYAPGTSSALTESVQDFSLPTSISPITVIPGMQYNTSFPVTPQSGFLGSISFTCTTPANMNESSCSATPVQITGATAAAPTLTIITTASHQVASNAGYMPGPGSTIAGVVLAGCVWLGIPAGRRRRLGSSIFFLLLLGFLGTVGCGGSGSGGGGSQTDPGTPAGGPYTLILTATSGTDTHSIDVSVTVQ